MRLKKKSNISFILKMCATQYRNEQRKQRIKEQRKHPQRLTLYLSQFLK